MVHLNFGEVYFGFKIMYINELIQLTQNKLNTILNQANLAFQEGRAEDYARLIDEAKEIEAVLLKLNS